MVIRNTLSLEKTGAIAIATIGIALLIGLVAGILAGMLGIGGGIISIPAMVLILGVEQHTAQGTALSVIVLTALAGSIIHWRQGNVNTRVAPHIILGAIAFSLLGAWISHLLASTFLTMAFGSLLLFVGTRMILSSNLS